VLLSQSRSRLPTLTDESERDPNAEEETEKTPETAQPLFATSPLPSHIRAELVAAQSAHPLTTIRTVIGRGADADIQISDRKASRRHASILYSGSEFRIRDEGSANGTLLNGSKVTEYVIRDGDELVVGETVMRFRAI
jgi:pSer/pThr/pTyr-binding forkhead associated (FHA) protein